MKFLFKNCEGKTIEFDGTATMADLYAAGVKDIALIGLDEDCEEDLDPDWYHGPANPPAAQSPFSSSVSMVPLPPGQEGTSSRAG